MTNFIKRHPGGQTILLFAVGRDATVLFETYHPVLSRAQKYLKQMPIVGCLIDHELPIFASRSKFHDALLKRIDTHFEKRDIKSPPILAWFIYFAIYAGLICSYYLQFVIFNDSNTIQVILAMLLGMFCALLGSHPLHDASHCSITRNPRIWLAFASTHDLFNGASSAVWAYQHILGHHPYTNIANADPDISVHETHDIRRILPSQRWYQIYTNQKIYVPILYAFLAIKTRLQDFVIIYITKMNGKIRINPLSREQTILFWSGKIFFLTYRILIPVYFFNFTWSKTLFLLFVSDVVMSYWLAFTFQANHVVQEVQLPFETKQGYESVDWAEMQLSTTLDYDTSSTACRLLTGALNLQAVHHLFPHVHQFFYTELSPIVSSVAKEFNVNYRNLPSFKDALLSHLMHLEAHGKKPSE